MPKIIVKIHHVKAGSKGAGFINYIAKRDRVDTTVNDRVSIDKPTEKQQSFINELSDKYPDIKVSEEYKEYIDNPTKNTASVLITTICENNPEIFSDRATYISYISTRPNVEKFGEHGLFGNEDMIDLKTVRDEVDKINGVLWTPIVSLQREDAARLGYDNAEAWKNLIRSKQYEIAEIFNIPIDDFKWYAAYHDEGDHPHMHMVIYSIGSQRGFINEKDIENIKRILAKEIFKNDMYEMYNEKTKMRELISEESKRRIAEIAEMIKKTDYSDSKVGQMIYDLAVKLKDVKGKKNYGYLTKSLKHDVDEIVKEISNDKNVSDMYNEWCNIQKKIIGTYHDKDIEFPPLYKNDEFRKIKNAIIKECEKLGNDYILKDEIENENEEREWSENSENRQSNEEYKFELNSQIALSTLNLFCRMSRIIENDSDKKIEGFNKTIVDSRERKREMERKHRMGIKMG